MTYNIITMKDTISLGKTCNFTIMKNTLSLGMMYHMITMTDKLRLGMIYCNIIMRETSLGMTNKPYIRQSGKLLATHFLKV